MVSSSIAFSAARSGDLRRGFTLIELLVAMGIMAMLGTMILMITDQVFKLTKQNHREMDRLSQVRCIFDRMALDFSGCLHRANIPFVAAKNEVNDVIGFYTRGRNSPGERGVSATRYRVVDHRLERTALAADWDARLFGKPADFPLAIDSSTTETTVDVLGEGILRFECLYRCKSGLTQIDPPTDIQDLEAIIVGIVALSAHPGSTFDETEAEQLSNAFPQAHPDSDFVTQWQPILNSLQSNNTPTRTKARGAGIFQRTFSLR